MREAAASIVIGSLESLKPNRDELRFFAKEKIPGFVLFKRNISQDDFHSLPSQLIKRLYDSRNDKTPLLIAVDQEGGRVRRLPSPFPNEGCAIRAGVFADNDREFLFNYGKEVGTELKKLRINVNFAPCVDILTNPLNVGIGDRSFGVRAEQVVRRAGSFLEGMQSAGVWGCLKHFPGQGSELSDTHNEKVTVPLSKETLMQREMMPYKQLLYSAKMVMVSHCIFSSLDSKSASLSRIVISDLLLKELAYTGLVLSDDMNMKAIAQDTQLWGEAIVEAIAAGTNAVLVCSGFENWVHAIEAIEVQARRSEAFANLLYTSAEKMQNFRINYLQT